MTKHACKYCKKAYTSESTLLVHVCVKKKRHSDKNTIGSRMGFSVFQRFFELTTSSGKKTFDDFVNSKFYTDFVKFGRYLADLNSVNTNAFVDYVITNNIKMRDWNTDKTYSKFLKHLIETETVARALERTIIEIDSWSSKNGTPMNDFFQHIGNIEATYLIRSGRLSPWVLYLSDTSSTLLSNFSDEQMKIIGGIIDASYWSSIFSARKEDVLFAKKVLKAANL